MCLVVKKGKKKIILSEDMIVYKKFEKIGSSYYSLFFGLEYTPGELIKADIELDTDLNCLSPYDRKAILKLDKLVQKHGMDYYETPNHMIHTIVDSYGPGIHFAKNRNRLNVLDSETNCIMRCTIPAGSEVIFDNSGLGITNQLILNKIDPIKWQN